MGITFPTLCERFTRRKKGCPCSSRTPGRRRFARGIYTLGICTLWCGAASGSLRMALRCEQHRDDDA